MWRVCKGKLMKALGPVAVAIVSATAKGQVTVLQMSSEMEPVAISGA